MVIDTNKLNTLSLHEVAALLLLYDSRTDKGKCFVEMKDSDLKDLYEKLDLQGYIVATCDSSDHSYNPPLRQCKYRLLQKGKEALMDNCIQDKAINKILSKKALAERCDSLAQELRKLYPSGTKPGTAYMWKDSVKVISSKLQRIIEEGNEFTDEEAINATKAYVDGFNGNYTYMQLLKYFIKKRTLEVGEVNETSQLMSYIQNIRTNPENVHNSNDWQVQLK
jgi:hypothetical protein